MHMKKHKQMQTQMQTQTFVKPQVKDFVFDRKQKVEGRILFIDHRKRIAKVEVILYNDKKLQQRTTELVESNLVDLIVLNKRYTEKPLEIMVKYFNESIEKIEKISKGDWIDLRSAVTIELKKGDFTLIPLGVGMKLPCGYEANIVPRSSTFKNYGIIQTNHFAVIDNSYSGDEDEWMLPVYATRDTVINFNDRICQFRINKKMPQIHIKEVEKLDDESRGGFGSTGVK